MLRAVSFVDDSTGQSNFFTCDVPPMPLELIKHMQHNAQLWNNLLWSSGGFQNVLTIVFIEILPLQALWSFVMVKLDPTC